jgi:hypothetical protein
MLEAMAHGAVPVVTAASSGIAGVIHPQDNGFVVPVGDMAAMAGVIARLAADHSLLADAGRAAYCTAQAYSMDVYARKFARILDEVAGADQSVDYHKRYGVFSPTHPLLVQRQLIAQKQAELDQPDKRALKRLFKGGWQGLRRSRSQPARRGDKRVA